MKTIKLTLCSALMSLCVCGSVSAQINLTEPETGAPEIKADKHNVNRLKSDYYIPNRFNGKTILVTGGAQGIGQWAAIRAAREGANVVIMDWLKDEGQHTTDSIKAMGGKAVFVYGDIQKDEDNQKAVQAAIDNYGMLDYAMLNAGVMDALYTGTPFEKYDAQTKRVMPSSIAEATNEYWEGVMGVNATGTFKSLRAVLNQMRNQGRGGAIVVVSSIAGMTGLAGNSAYIASKHAVNGLVKSAAVDYAPYGIRVNSVNMAQTDTPMSVKAYEFVAEKQKAGVGFGMGGIKTMSLQAYTDSEHRASEPWEQSSNMLYLISDEASAITGAIIATDGGWTSY